MYHCRLFISIYICVSLIHLAGGDFAERANRGVER